MGKDFCNLGTYIYIYTKFILINLDSEIAMISKSVFVT